MFAEETSLSRIISDVASNQSTFIQYILDLMETMVSICGLGDAEIFSEPALETYYAIQTLVDRLSASTLAVA